MAGLNKQDMSKNNKKLPQIKWHPPFEVNTFDKDCKKVDGIDSLSDQLRSETEKWVCKLPVGFDAYYIIKEQAFFYQIEFEKIAEQTAEKFENAVSAIVFTLENSINISRLFAHLSYLDRSFGNPQIGAKFYYIALHHFITNSEGFKEYRSKAIRLKEFIIMLQDSKMNAKEIPDVKILQNMWRRWVDAIPDLECTKDVKGKFKQQLFPEEAFKTPKNTLNLPPLKIVAPLYPSYDEFGELLVLWSRDLIENFKELNEAKSTIESALHIAKRMELSEAKIEVEREYRAIFSSWLICELEFNKKVDEKVQNEKLNDLNSCSYSQLALYYALLIDSGVFKRDEMSDDELFRYIAKTHNKNSWAAFRKSWPTVRFAEKRTSNNSLRVFKETARRYKVIIPFLKVDEKNALAYSLAINELGRIEGEINKLEKNK